MLLLIFFIAIIPFAITGIIAQLGYYSGIKPELKSGFYTITILVTSIFFYLPLILTDERFYFLWLFWTGVFLSITYFNVKKNKKELQASFMSRLIGSIFLLTVLTCCFIVLYAQKTTL